jgi:hypothetical protein
MIKVDEKTEITIVQQPLPHSVPSHLWRAHWLTTTEFARMMGRSPWTVQTWLKNGTLAEFGIPVCQFRQGKRHSGRTFILNVY